MNTELRKRLEEAADIHCKCDTCILEHKATGGCLKKVCSIHNAYLEGAEYGYKEAIKIAKGWLEENTETRMPDDEDKDFVWVQSVRYEGKGELIARFEADMSKLLEEQK